ncbi:MAG: hypothetical protein ABIJ22_01460, partial [Patescibacteria group bacterium]
SLTDGDSWFSLISSIALDAYKKCNFYKLCLNQRLAFYFRIIFARKSLRPIKIVYSCMIPELLLQSLVGYSCI